MARLNWVEVISGNITVITVILEDMEFIKPHKSPDRSLEIYVAAEDGSSSFLACSQKRHPAPTGGVLLIS